MLPGHPLCWALFQAVHVKCQGRPTALLPGGLRWASFCLFPSRTPGAAHSAAGYVMSPHCLAAYVGTCGGAATCNGWEQAQGGHGAHSVVTSPSVESHPDSEAAKLSLPSWWVLRLKQVLLFVWFWCYYSPDTYPSTKQSTVWAASCFSKN